MFARRKIYGMMMIGAMLLAGCSHDGVDDEILTDPTATEGTPVPISFDCIPYNYYENGSDNGASDNENNTTRAVIGYTGAMDSEDIYYTGFGVFASVTATTDKKPDMMYNQEVAFTFVGDMANPLEGFWSYQPLKYWPNDLSRTDFFISAYAPYQTAPVSATSDDTGIIGISGNTAEPSITFRRCEKAEECVDLLWYYEKPSSIPTAGKLRMQMRHALARLEISVKAQAAPASGTKVLIEEITLTGQMAKTGTLHLYEQTTEGSGNSTKYYPVWSDQTYDSPTNRTITISNDDENTTCYCLIDENVRYIAGLPYSWQPAGLSTTAKNALSTIDRKTYVYLIPQASLSLMAEVKYKKMDASGNIVSGTKKTVLENTTTDSPIVISPLRGNTTYKLNLNLRDL